MIKYSEQWDAYYDETTNEWTESKCDDPTCAYCVGRPDKYIDEEEVRAAHIERLLDAVEYAIRAGLDHEFMDFFLQEYDRSGDIMKAVEYAEREWDL